MKDIPIAVFDIIVAVVALVGLLRGRKRGMSGEIFDLFMWLGIAFGSAFACRAAGAELARLANLSLLWGHVLAYLAAGLIVFSIFAIIKNALRERLGGSDFFKGLEYPLGMLSGIIRFCCILLVLVALINARLYTEQERAESAKQQKENFGSISFPTLGEVQNGIFQDSYAGKFIDKNLQMLLIPRLAPATSPAAKENLKRKRESELERVIGK